MKSSNKHQKLLTPKQFRAVYDKGRKFNTPFFSAFILKTDGHEHRVGITVTRKLGGAVLRNRCKRRIREILRRNEDPALNDIGYDMVINAKEVLSSADFRQLEEAFRQTLARFRIASAKQDE